MLLIFIMLLVAVYCVTWTWLAVRLVRTSLATGRITFWRIDWLTIWIWGPSVARADRLVTFWFFLVGYALSVAITLFVGFVFFVALSLG